MSASADIWAVVPVKGGADAKQRLGDAVAPELRRRLALAMAEDVLATLATAPGLRGMIVVTADPAARALAGRYGARVLADGAEAGQTGAVAAAARLLARERRAAMLTIPGDVPLIAGDEVACLIAAHDRVPDFVIAPAHDERGSNAVLCAPPDAVPLSFGDDSFLPHLEAARRAGIAPKVLRLPGIALDIDRPRDLDAFLKIPSATRARALLEAAGVG
ncbi:MAG TPA: 2-phospho-L-lactate guanylyltransferase [Xanthobacteraceae bacterium]|nr:2-phospho-L-lactate guanylyltransferase [Xanthobacteraceae bacterium]